MFVSCSCSSARSKLFSILNAVNFINGPTLLKELSLMTSSSGKFTVALQTKNFGKQNLN